ncbi:MAG TPA: hypothetical protein VIJ39_08355 [Solirubrobacteraceae bacterium]
MTTNDVLVLVILAVELLGVLFVPNLPVWMTTSRWTHRQISRPRLVAMVAVVLIAALLRDLA